MSSQKQSHRVRQYERWHENIVKENEELKKKVAYFERRPPVYRVFKYMKWKKEATHEHDAGRSDYNSAR